MRISTTVLLVSIVALVSCQTVVDVSYDSGASDEKSGSSAEQAASSLSVNWKQENINTTSGADYLSDIEKQVIIEVNMVRTDPAKYAVNYLEPLRQYYRGKLFQYPGDTAIQTSEGSRALDECIKELMSVRPLRALSPRKDLTLAAKKHAKDQARKGATRLNGSDHSTFIDGVNRYGKGDLSAGENIGYGNGQARRIVTSFLIDDGVTPRGHRKNLLNGTFNFIGVAVGPHSVYGKMCVMNFAGEYK
jgi:uncharacterized protein YkwD